MPRRLESRAIAIRRPEDLEQLGRGLGVAALRTANYVGDQLGQVTRGLRLASMALEEVTPLDFRAGEVPKAEKRVGFVPNELASILLRADASSQLAVTGADFLIRDPFSTETVALMAAIANGALRKGDDDGLGLRIKAALEEHVYGEKRTMTRASKINILQMLDITPLLYEVSGDPTIAGAFKQVEHLARVYVSIAQAHTRHTGSYARVMELQTDLLDRAQIMNEDRPELLKRRTAANTELRAYVPRLKELGRLIVNGRDTMSDVEFNRLSAEYEEIRRAFGKVRMVSNDTTMKLIEELLMERQATTGAILLDERMNVILETLGTEMILMVLCLEGVATSLSAVSNLLMHASRALLRLQTSMGEFGSDYDPKNDQSLQNAISTVTRSVREFEGMVREHAVTLGNPMKVEEIEQAIKKLTPVARGKR